MVSTTNFLRQVAEPAEGGALPSYAGTNFMRAAVDNSPLGEPRPASAQERPAADDRIPEGCRLCMAGLKLPVYLTMQCNTRCYFCPIDPALLAADVCLVRDRIVTDLNDIVPMGAHGLAGVSISGGEPLMRIDRAVALIDRLKKTYGDGFHVHLYTNGRLLTPSVVTRLEDVGLDELRISSLDVRVLTLLANSRIKAAVETVALAERAGHIKETMERLPECGIRHMILTEAEINEFNRQGIARAQADFQRAEPTADEAADSLTTAKEIRAWAQERHVPVDIHICTRSNAFLAAQRRERLLERGSRETSRRLDS